MKGGSKLDEEVLLEFYDNRDLLKSIANEIIATVDNENIVSHLYNLEDEQDEIEFVKEGKVIYKLHKLRERDTRINKKKKDDYIKEYGRLNCEVCDFDFYNTYGELGKGYVECHHRIPLSELKSETKTTTADLALVCSNCHRMLHRKINTLSIKELKKIYLEKNS